MFSEITPKLSIYTNEDFEPLIFPLKIGKYKIGSESSCDIHLHFDEIDTLHGILTIYENGECTYESVSLNFVDHRFFQIPFHSQKNKVPIRKNKEIDITHETVFFISKFKAIFEYEQINSKTSLESDEIENKIEQDNNHLKIKNIFRRSFEKIRIDIKQRNDPKMKLAFAKFNEEFHNSQDAFSKFESLYESFKPLFNIEKSEESISTQNLSALSLMLSTDEKSRKKMPLLEKTLMNDEEKDLKIIYEENNSETANKDAKNVILSNIKDHLNDGVHMKLTYQDCEDDKNELRRNKNSCEESQIIDNLAGLLNMDAIHDKFFKGENIENPQEPEILGATILQNPSLEKLDPTILQSQNANELEQMDPTILQSQHAENLDATMPQSQLKLNENFLEPTLPQQETNNLGNSLGPTLPQINDNLGSNLPQGNYSNSQGNKLRKKLVKPSAKKTKIEKSDEKLKNEKRIKFEKIMLEENINSLKLFRKDNIDDLEDLFDKPILSSVVSKENEIISKNNDPYSFSSPNHISKENINSDFALNSFKKDYVTSPTYITQEIEEKKASKDKKTKKNPTKDQKNQKDIGFFFLKRAKTSKPSNSNEENMIKEKEEGEKKQNDDEGENIYQISQTQNNIPDDKTEKLSSAGSQENSEIIKASKKPRRAKINKTLTQLFTIENNQDFIPEFIIAISVKKLKKTQIKLLNELKIKIVEDVTEDESVIINALVADELSTKPKILICINKGIRIISDNWIDDVLNQKKIIKTLDDYDFKDQNFENKYKINLKQSLELAKLNDGFLKGYNVFIHDTKFSLNNKMLEKIIISAKGNLIHTMPSKGTEKHLVLVDLKNHRLIQSLVEDNIRFFTKENLIDFCLRQTFD